MLRATTACTFSTSQLPKVVRSSSVLSILTWKCASRRNGVHFFMSHLASWLRTRRFSKPTFRPSGATNHWKNTVNRDFPIFSRIYLFFLLIFSLLTLFTSAFQLSILSEVSLLNFLRSFTHLSSFSSRIFPHFSMNISIYFEDFPITRGYSPIVSLLQRLPLHPRTSWSPARPAMLRPVARRGASCRRSRSRSERRDAWEK